MLQNKTIHTLTFAFILHAVSIAVANEAIAVEVPNPTDATAIKQTPLKSQDEQTRVNKKHPLRFSPADANHVLYRNNRWLINGIDPFIVSNSLQLPAQQARLARIELVRYGSSTPFQDFQIFIATNRHSFEESNSIIVRAKAQSADDLSQYYTLQIPLQRGKSLHPETQTLSKIRLDFASLNPSPNHGEKPIEWEVKSAVLSTVNNSNGSETSNQMLIRKKFAIGKRKMLAEFLSKLADDWLFIIFYLALLSITAWFFFVRPNRQ